MEVFAKGQMHTYAEIEAQHKRAEQSEQPFQGVKEEVVYYTLRAPTMLCLVL